MPNAKQTAFDLPQSSPDTAADISVIVPLLNEAADLPALIDTLRALPVAQVILVDGGSTDGTRELLEPIKDEFTAIHSLTGRARQMNAGADEADQEFLLFLHADTRLPHGFEAEVVASEYWGRFDVQFDTDHAAMRVIAFFINLRSRLSKVATGDQAIFVRRDLFNSIGGYDDIPLMEDVALCKTLRSKHNPHCSKLQVTTSARRWQENGIILTVLKMWWYRLAYFLGVSPATLKRGYKDIR